jgi:ribosomal protein S18 acetylase RimI-like enzyme
MATVTVRTFGEQDRAAVIALWEVCGLTRSWNDPGSDIDRKIAVDGSLLIVAELDGTVVGSVMAGYDGHRGWINYLAADPVVQRSGIGARLMLEAERRLAALGCPKVNLQVRRDNQDVAAFYERLGYLDDDVVSFGKRLTVDDAP